jgi:outer membrane protein
MKTVLHIVRTGRLTVAGLLLLVAMVLQAVPVPPAGAQVAEAPRFAIIDVQRVLRESLAAKGLNKQIGDLRSAYQAEIRKQEKDLRGVDQELARQRTILSSEIFAQKRQELERRVATLQREVQVRKRALDRSFAKGLSQVQAEVAKIAAAIADEMGLDLIFSKATVVIVKPEFEITAEVSKRLNKQLPAVSVEIPQQ